MNHTPVESKVVIEYEEHDGPGPDLADLCFDMSRALTSKWNQAAFNLIRIDFCAKHRQEKDFPSRSNSYFADLIRDRFRRLWNVWKKAQAQTDSDGHEEDLDEIENRMVESKTMEHKASRMASRRLGVRQKIP